jgi:tetratricopeptide (TPR) repeat protein
MPLSAGSRLGPYEVLGPLGAGGMGEVYRARDPRLGRDVAIKVIASEGDTSPERRRRFEDEARAAGALNHANILTVFDVGSHEGRPYVVFELLQGKTLRERLLRGPLPVRTAVGYAEQTCDGLAAAHEKGIVHRDLKPENLFLTADGRVKILDFGLAKLTQDLKEPGADPDAPTRTHTEAGVRLGTLTYMSPEQARGQPADKRSDIFSVGVFLHEMLSGSPPFRRDSDADTLAAILHENPPELRARGRTPSRELEAIVRRCLEKEPDRRFQTARDLAFALSQVRESGRRVVVRWPLLAIAVALVFAVSVVLLQRAAVPHAPRAVLVMEPRMVSSPPDEPSRLAAFALREAIVRTLATLGGVEPMSPDELPEGVVSVPAAARAAAADEVVVSNLACQGQWCQVSLRRERGRDAHVIGDTGSFDVWADPEGSLPLANAVAIHVRRAFSEYQPRSPDERLEVLADDYRQYLSLRRRMESGEVLTRLELEQLDRISRSSPGLTEAALLAAATARGLPDRSLAQRLLREAEAHHPRDPRLLYERFALELETGNVADAAAALSELEKLAPGDLLVWRAQAGLLSRQGKLQEAATVRRRMVLERPSWKNLWYAADVEMELGDADAARRHLEHLLQVSPGNPRGLAKIALLELMLGDPAKAVVIYEDLLKEKVTRQNLSNLGWSLLLAGDYRASARAYRQALDLEPEHLLSRLNLGIAQEGAGDADGARRLYRDLLDRFTRRERQGALTVSERLIKAQALARLGDSVPAVALTNRALGEGDRDVQVVFQAAIIYALCGDQNNAIVHAQEARKRGLSRRWFSVPGFEALRATPAFRALL